MKFAYKIIQGRNDEEFEADLNRYGQKGYKVIRMFDSVDGQKSIMEKQIFEPDDRDRRSPRG